MRGGEARASGAWRTCPTRKYSWYVLFTRYDIYLLYLRQIISLFEYCHNIAMTSVERKQCEHLHSVPLHLFPRPDRHSHYLSSGAINEFFGRTPSRNRQALPDPEQEETRSQLCSPLATSELELSEYVDEMLQVNSRLRNRKRENLYRNWSDRVYHRISTELGNALNSEQFQIQDQSKRTLYTSYLQFSNRRNVHLDTAAKEYDPFPGRLLTLPPHSLHDPLHSRQAEDSDETSVLSACGREAIGLKERTPVYPLRHTARQSDSREFNIIPLYQVDSPQRFASQSRLTHHSSRNGTDAHLHRSYSIRGDNDPLSARELEQVLTSQMSVQRKKLFYHLQKQKRPSQFLN